MAVPQFSGLARTTLNPTGMPSTFCTYMKRQRLWCGITYHVAMISLVPRNIYFLLVPVSHQFGSSFGVSRSI